MSSTQHAALAQIIQQKDALEGVITQGRLGIMGGTFDPIHYGHLVTAEYARMELELDQVLFMPTGNPARKRLTRAVTDKEHRAAMVELAIASNPSFMLSRLDLDRDAEVTYTIDTLSELRSSLPPAVSLYFITGADAILNILSWHRAIEFASLATFVAATRPGYDLDHFKQSDALSQMAFDVRYIEIPALSISSTYLRKQIARQKSVRYLTHPRVITYIEENHLYRTSD